MDYGAMDALRQSPLVLLGLITIASLVSAKFLSIKGYLPRVTTFMLGGMILGPSGFEVMNGKMLEVASTFTDIALSIILYELGRNLDFTWKKHDKWLVICGVSESLFSFALIFLSLLILGFEPLYAATAATLGIGSSPAIIFVIAKELNAEGQIVKRSKALAAINNIIRVLSFTALLPLIHYKYQTVSFNVWKEPLYILLGSLLLGSLAYLLLMFLAKILGKDIERQTIIILSIILSMVGISYHFQLSLLIVMLVFGIFTKNWNKGILFEPNFGIIEELSTLTIFLIVGAHLQWQGLIEALMPTLIFLTARFTGKFIPIYFLSKKSGLNSSQASLLGLSLIPMAGLSLGIAQTVGRSYPEFGQKLSSIVIHSLVLMQLIGPLFTQYAFKKSGEAHKSVH